MLCVADKWQRKRRRERERAREGYTGSGTALPQGRTPNLGHNYTEADVARPFPRRRLGAAVTPRDYSRFRNNNYLIPEVYNAQPGWNAGSNWRKERKTGSLSVHLVMLPRAIKMQNIARACNLRTKSRLASSKDIAVIDCYFDLLYDAKILYEAKNSVFKIGNIY